MQRVCWPCVWCHTIVYHAGATAQGLSFSAEGGYAEAEVRAQLRDSNDCIGPPPTMHSPYLSLPPPLAEREVSPQERAQLEDFDGFEKGRRAGHHRRGRGAPRARPHCRFAPPLVHTSLYQIC